MTTARTCKRRIKRWPEWTKERSRLAHAAKAQRRLERALDPRPDKTETMLELGVRDMRSGETAWVPFRSLRDAMRRLTVVARYYRPIS